MSRSRCSTHFGAPTGRSIAGAVTIELTGTPLDYAKNDDLWVQGGTPDDPVLNQLYPGAYGFGALRCAIDNYNGDNVEYIAYPLGALHVFCFAYYVAPPPTSGTIVVRKEVDAPGDVAAHDFRLSGNLSYNAGGAFTLNAAPRRPASATFYRAGGDTWTVHEVSEPGWTLLGLSCASQTGASAASSPAGSTDVDVQLAAGDTVTCTYRNGLQPPPVGLTLGKVTLGSTGETSFRVRGDVGVADATFSTTEPGVPTYFELPPLPASEYRISEEPRDLVGGRWQRRQVRCGGRIVEDDDDPVIVTPPAGAGLVCVWVNEFVPAGSIRVRKVMTGATGATGFTIRPINADPPVVYEQRAVVSREGVAATAAGDSTDRLRLGTYDIQETTPTGSGTWRLESVTCNGVPVGSAQGRIRIRLTADEPDVTCTFADRYSRAQPSPPEGGAGPGRSDPSPHANVAVSKRVKPTSIVSGRPVRYTVVVRNTGTVSAHHVVVAEHRPASQRPVSIEAPARVRRRGTRPLRCVIGTLRPGRRITLRATYTTALTGRVVNHVAVHTSTAETRLNDNRARAVLQVARPRPGACAARAGC